MEARIIGIDPSFTHFAICDGERTEIFKTEPVPDVTEETSTILRIEHILSGVQQFLLPLRDVEVETRLYIEAPQLNVPAHGGTHLYQLGMLMRDLYRLAGWECDEGYQTVIYQAPQPTVLKTLFGARVVKNQVSAYAQRKYGVLFDDDRGNDRLYAFLMFKYGCGVRDGEFEQHVSQRRGSKRKGKAKILRDATDG